ncbi:hypothetical protein OC846_002249 [Tilletia horrida]|uniref:Uncharacterized protein n=1 Tax=Tilletia horrida TaxID=155126 RepID=A0AAN6GRG5_9BASI|nr:hypothetical protein OC845_004886 [Tilletia horrida]KAK0554028.1 hypothetical protein OC846_002249 [Tilletia horrida]
MAMGSLWASYGTERRQARLLEPEPRLQGPKRGPRHSETSHLSRSLTSTTDVLMMTVLSSWTSTLVHATDYNSSPGPEQRDSGQSDKWTMTYTRDERRAELGTKLFANRRKQYERNLLGDEEYHYKMFARSRAKLEAYSLLHRLASRFGALAVFVVGGWLGNEVHYDFCDGVNMH